jgi:hypothetical protein
MEWQQMMEHKPELNKQIPSYPKTKLPPGVTLAKRFPRYIAGRPNTALLVHVIDRVEIEWKDWQGETRVTAIAKCRTNFRVSTGKRRMFDDLPDGVFVCQRCLGLKTSNFSRHTHPEKQIARKALGAA